MISSGKSLLPYINSCVKTSFEGLVSPNGRTNAGAPARRSRRWVSKDGQKNINGLRSHLDELKLMINDLGIHILALNETKLDPGYPKELTDVSGFQQERLDRTCHGGGVSIYIRDSIKYKLRSDVPTDDLEMICIEVEPPKSKSFLVLAWYRPPSDPVGTFDKLEKVLSFLDKEGKEIILLGDTNCDLTPKLAEQPLDNDSKHMLDLYELFSFKQLVEEPTRVTLATSSIIDHVATICQKYLKIRCA